MEGGLERVEVGKLRHTVAADGDQTVHILGSRGTFLAVFVDKTARVDGSHLGAVESGNFFEFARGLDAAVFGEENGNRVVAERLHLLRPGGGLVGGVIAPGVVIESEEVTSLVISTAVHIVGGLNTVVINVSSRIADRDRAVFAVANVRLHVTSDSFNVWCCGGSCNAVDIFVTREEE